MGWGFSEKVRDIYRKAGSRPVANEEVALALDLFGKGRGRLTSAQRDLLKSGEISRVSEGVYVWANRSSPTQIREAMWRVIRARRAVSVADLMELTGASENYALEYLRMLVRREAVKKISKAEGVIYRLVVDAGTEAPKDESKAERLRRIRERKKEALAALDEAWLAINRARMAITETE